MLRTGYTKNDRWTADRERDMVLFRRAGRYSQEDHSHDYWSFIDRKGRYYLITELLSRVEISAEEIAITRSFIYSRREQADVPDAESIGYIKEALCERGKWHLFNPEAFKHCQLTLIDARTGKKV
jgi:hypothetical protein